MSEKFAITAELQLALDSKVNTVIDQLRGKLNGLKISLDQSSIKSVYNEVNTLSKSLKSKPLNIRLALSKDSIKEYYKEIKTLYGSTKNKPIELRLRTNQADIKNFYREINALQNSVKNNPILIRFGLLEASIKNIYANYRQVRASLANAPLLVSINVQNKSDLLEIFDVISKVKSRRVSFNFDIRKGSVEKFQILKDNLNSINSALATFNTGQLGQVTGGLRGLAKSLTLLKKLSTGKFSFDLSIKDIRSSDQLAKSVESAGNSFEKATLKASRFNRVIASLASNIALLRNNLKGIDLKEINRAGAALKRLQNPKPIAVQQNLAKTVSDTTDSFYKLGQQSADTFKRFGVYTVVTASFFRLTSAIRGAVSEFIDFNKELTTIRQVTKQSVTTTAELGDEVGRLATLYGVSSSSILDTSQVLAQAGFTSKQTQQALEALTKTEIAPTFENIENTVEGAVAAMAQFNIKTEDLEENLSSINSVSAAFAVESEDITTAIQKAGGSFAAAGGSLEELNALFTSVRSTTRESADTIATGFRTIFTRLQRVRTGKFLENFGVNIRKTAEDVKILGGNVGDFVGPYEAIRRLSEATSGIGSADPRFAQIVEELGGFRQINKVIPLLQNFAVAEDALRIATTQRNSLTEDAIIAQESYANQIEKVKEEFVLLIREIGEDKNIKEFIFLLLDLAKAGIEVAKSFREIIPLIAILGAVRGIGAGKSIVRGFTGAEPLSRNGGGYVPGFGPDKDTVPAMLTTGEYVLNRKAVRKIGIGNLDAINNGVIKRNAGGPVGYNRGGIVSGSTAAAVGGAVLLGSGLLESFNNLEDASKSFLSGLIGVGAQFLVLKAIVGSSQDQIKSLSKTINKIAPRKSFTPDGRPSTRSVAPNRRAAREATERQQLARIDSSISERSISKTLDQSNKERINNQRVSSRDLQLRQQISPVRSRLQAIGTTDSSAIRKQIAQLEIAANQVNPVEKVPVDPRSFAARKLGLKEEFRTKDENTGVFKRTASSQQYNDIERDRQAAIKQIAVLEKRADVIDKNTQEYRKLSKEIKNNAQQFKNNPGLQTRIGAQQARSQSNRDKIRGTDPETTRARLQNFINNGFREPKTRPGGGFARSLTNARFTPKTLSRIGGVGAVTGLAGNFIGGQLQERARPTNANPTGSQAQSVLGGALSSAAASGATGAFIGSFLGPLGTAIGGAGGGLIGGIYGVVTSFDQFKSSLDVFNASKAIDSLDNTFESISSGLSTFGSSSVGIGNDLEKLRNSLQGGSSNDARQDIFAGLERNATNINQFVRETANASNGFQDFSSKIDSSTQLFISSILDIPFDEFQDKVKNIIKTTQDQIDQNQKLVASIQNFDNIINATNSFRNAFEKASSSVNIFSNNLESFASGGLGNIDIANTLSNALSNLSLSDSTTTSRVGEFSNQFGQAGFILGQRTQDITKVIQELPGILLQLRSESALSSEGDLESRLDTALSSLSVDGQQIDTGVINLVLSRFSDLLGEDFKDSNFFQALEKDFPKAVADLSAGLESIPSLVADSYRITNEQLNELANSLSNITNLDQQITQGLASIFDKNAELISSRASFTGQNAGSALINNARNRQNVLTGGRNVNQLTGDIARRRNNIQSLSTRIDSTENISLQQRLINLRAQEVSALQKSKDGLETLANSTNLLSSLQSKLNDETSNRLSKRSFAADFSFGDLTSQFRTQQTLGFAQNVARTGDISRVPDEFRSEVKSFLDQFANQEIGNTGVTGEEAINKVISRNLNLPKSFRDSIRPGAEETNLQTQVENVLKTQIDAQNSINQILTNDRQAFSAQLNKDFQNFLNDLKSGIEQSNIDQTTTSIQNLSGKRAGLIDQANTLGRVRNNFGENALPNIDQISSVLNTIKNNSGVSERINVLTPQLSEAFKNLSLTRTNTFGAARNTEQAFQSSVAPIIANLPENQQKQVIQQLSTGDIGRNRAEGTINVAKAREIVLGTLANISRSAQGDLSSAQSNKQEIISRVGGQESFNKIVSNLPALEKISKDFGNGSNLEQLNKEISGLTSQISALKDSLPKSSNPLRRNAGGSVPGFGSTDSVPALLTPGEFVLNKQAVKSVGLETLRKTNSGARRFQNGGIVTGQSSIMDMEAVNRFNSAVSQLSMQVQNIKDALSVIPTEINLVGRHTVDVYINGAQAFDSMKAEFSSLVMLEVKRGINNMLKSKFPQVGSVE